jgi:hypothetical protein
MCDSCIAHQEWRRQIENLIKRLPRISEQLNEFNHPYLEIVEETPGALPNGTGIFTPIGWIRWAKKQLGYES